MGGGSYSFWLPAPARTGRLPSISQPPVKLGSCRVTMFHQSDAQLPSQSLEREAGSKHTHFEVGCLKLHLVPDRGEAKGLPLTSKGVSDLNGLQCAGGLFLVVETPSQVLQSSWRFCEHPLSMFCSNRLELVSVVTTENPS